LWLLFGIVKSASLTRAAAVLCLHTLQAALGLSRCGFDTFFSQLLPCCLSSQHNIRQGIIESLCDIRRNSNEKAPSSVWFLFDATGGNLFEDCGGTHYTPPRP
jgi:hypothetical protein